MCPHPHPGAIAIVPRRRRMDHQVAWQLQLGNSPQVLFQNRGFDLQLVFVGGVLVMASAAGRKVGATGLDPTWRAFEDLVDAGTGEASLLFGQDSFYPLIFQDEWDENCLAASVFIGRQTGQTIATVNQFLDLQFQDVILCQTRAAGRQSPRVTLLGRLDCLLSRIVIPGSKRRGI